MAKLSNHQSNEYTKALVVGDSKAGKTGGLTSLVKAGYKLRILDLDNGLDVLKEYVLKECPDKIDNIEFRTLRDKRKTGPAGPMIDGQPKAFVNTLRMMDNWKYTEDDGTEVDLGKPSEWGPDTILVVDSLSRLSDAAYDWREPLTPKGQSGKPDGRAVYGEAQDAVTDCIALLTSEAFRTNLIVLAHVRYIEMANGVKKGFPQSVGQAICTEIPQWFNTYIMFENEGGRRRIRTTSTPLIDLANPKPFAMGSVYDISTGMADIFGVLRSPPAK